MRLAGIRETSLFDGRGIYYVIFVQGCAHHCVQCQNKGTWDFNGGYEVSVGELKESISKYIGFIDGITLSGGDPAYQLDELRELIDWAKEQGLSVLMYTGFTLQELQEGHYNLDGIDCIIDGLYDHRKHTRDVPFRGSTNQKMYFNEAGKWVSEEEHDRHGRKKF